MSKKYVVCWLNGNRNYENGFETFAEAKRRSFELAYDKNNLYIDIYEVIPEIRKKIEEVN